MPKFAWLALATLLLVPGVALGQEAAPLIIPSDVTSLPAPGPRSDSQATVVVAELPEAATPEPGDGTEAEEPGAQDTKNEQTAYTTIPDTEFGGLSTTGWNPTDSGFSFGPTVSTLGIGAEAGYRFGDYFGLRAAGNYFADDLSLDYEGVDYEADYMLMSAGALADFYPFRKYLRVTAGIYYNRNGADLYLPARDMTFKGVKVSAADVGPMEGSVSFRSYAPYVGFGLQGSFFDGDLLVGADFGVFFQGEPDVELSGNSAFASNPLYQQEVDREIEKIEGDTHILGTYPVISLSLIYRF